MIITLTDTGNAAQNTAALNTAISDAHNGGGGEIFIDAAEYELTYSGSKNDMVILRSKKNITIRGRGTKQTTFLWDEAVYPATQGQDRYMFSSNQGTENIKLRNFSVNGKRDEIVAAGNWIGGAQFHVLNIYASRKIDIIGLDLYNCLADAVRLLGDIRDTNVLGCHITNCGRSGISIQGGTRIRIAHNVITPPISDQAIDLESPRAKDHVIIEDNWLENGSAAKVFAPVASGTGGGFHVRGNTMIGDVFIYGPENTTINDNRFLGGGFHVKFGEDISIRNNYFETDSNVEGGVKINGGTNLVIFEGNRIKQIGDETAVYLEDIPNLIFVNNDLISANASATGLRWIGISANTNSPLIRVSGNSFDGFDTAVHFKAKSVWQNSTIHIMEIINNAVWKNGGADPVTAVLVEADVAAATTISRVEGNLA